MTDNALFVLIVAMLAYRAIDIFATRLKLDQVSHRLRRFGTISQLSEKRAVLIAFGQESRYFVLRMRIIQWIRRNFLIILMATSLLIFTVVGFSLAVSESVQNGQRDGVSFQNGQRDGVSFQNGQRDSVVVAACTAVVSVLASFMGLLIEGVREVCERKGV